MAIGKFLLLPVLIFAFGVSIAQTGINTPWYWRHGDYMINHRGIYTTDPQHPFLMPGARAGSASWTGSNSDLWLFGGDGYDVNGLYGYLSDLWKYSGTQWFFIKGNQTTDISASYGTIGIASNSNSPGARTGISGWSDNSGNFWLFGGLTVSPANWQFLNDLWKYDPATNQWTWMHGDSSSNQPAVYGTIGVPNSSNKPGARSDAITWKDNSGNFWLLGGRGPSDEVYNDLWKFNPQTNEWTWMKGASIAFDGGVYGTQNVPDPANKPGSRFTGASWTDFSGQLWLYGGSGFGESLFSGGGTLSDLWRYDPSTNEWTWTSGDKIINQPAVFGIQGVENISNTPGAKTGAYPWLDESGNIWLFGGWGYGFNSSYYGNFNTLWKYNLLTGKWAWMKGSQLPDQAGDYNVGGVPGFINHPGSRARGESWTTPGTFWMFGGFGSAITTYPGFLNDLWTLSSTQINILPVTLKNFWATLSGNNVCIYWEASQEENFSHYNLQRSRDANLYNNIAVIPGKGGQPGVINFYSYQDADAMGIVEGKIFYRLEMVDKNGTSRFSSIVMISKGTNGLALLIYPNPTSGLCRLVIENALDASAQLLILNSSGMEVEEKMLKLAKGRNVFSMDVGRYAPGIYVLRLRTSSGTIDNKLIIQ